jgi:hypothetical protein
LGVLPAGIQRCAMERLILNIDLFLRTMTIERDF